MTLTFETRYWCSKAQHRVKHVPWYDFWFHNCQRYAVRHIAEHILCRNCYSSEFQAVKNNFTTLQNLSVKRYFDRLFILCCPGYNLYQWCGGHEAYVKIMFIRRDDTRKNKFSMLLWVILTSCTIYIMKIYHNVFHKNENEQRRKYWPMVLENVRDDNELQERCKKFILRKNKVSLGLRNYEFVALLTWGYFDDQITLLRFVSFVLLLMLTTGLGTFFFSIEMPEEGQGAASDHCDECSNLLLVVHTHYKRCQQFWCSTAMFTNDRHTRLTFKSLVSPTRENQAYLFVRCSVAILLIIFMQIYHLAIDDLNFILGAQMLLNNVASVTDWSNGMGTF